MTTPRVRKVNHVGTGPELEFTLINATELFTFLVGRVVAWNESPMQVFANFCFRPKPAADILTFWLNAGFIRGNMFHWELTLSYNTASASTKTGGISQFELVREYRHRLKRVSKDAKPQGNVATVMRKLIQTHGSLRVQQHMDRFFKLRLPDHKIEAFATFLKSSKS